MPKRKSHQQEAEDSDSDASIINVDFDFCDFKPQIDYLAIKRLLQQLVSSDSILFDLGSISDLILSQDDVGTTIKTDGVESDPFGFIALLPLAHRQLKTLKDYLLSKSSGDAKLHKFLQNNMDTIGLIISERVYNLPPQVVPPLYKILGEEIGWAVEDNKPYSFTHYLILSRIYKIPPGDEEDFEESTSKNSTKKRKTEEKSKEDKSGVRSFHAEDETILKHTIHNIEFPYSHQQPRHEGDIGSSTAGVDVGGRMMVLSAEKLPALVTELERVFPVPT